ncbi:MAG TPA: 4-hydroxythreonine-4-phosphate dehydrogenase PdxA [Acidobacteriota bacterium]|nr:4-hydroxythreonine-4-phosphate dehydrogenase PdxA [Acidobacteriota bacterium]
MIVPAIGISLGDPGGIGPEVVLKALATSSLFPEARFVVFGDRRVWDAERAVLGLRLESPIHEGDTVPPAPGLYFNDIGAMPGDVVRGRASGENGKSSFLAFEKAVELAGRGILDAVVTAPVSKTSWRLAGLPWRGHTEYLDSLYPGAIMTFWSERLKVALLSHHIPLTEAVGRVRKDVLLDFFRALHRSLAGVRSGIEELFVAGLNPHAGEDGLLGAEETTEIRPAIEEAAREGIPVSGPFPPDTVFLKALDRPTKMVVAMSHDQGLIGFKLVAFETGVNTTLGMPFVRTSPDHGTAFDIAGKGTADPRSMLEALRLAVRLSAFL